MTAADPCFLTIAEAASLISEKRLSPVELARAYLDGTEPFQDRSQFPLPDLIVSDLKLYGETGAQFHAWLRAHHKEYPGCWIAVHEDRLIAADPDLRRVHRAVRATLGDQGAVIYFEASSSE